jgi:hypothetical protein
MPVLRGSHDSGIAGPKRGAKNLAGEMAYGAERYLALSAKAVTADLVVGRNVHITPINGR